MRVYVAGPMTGKPLLNYPAFQRAAASLRASGFEVINPAELHEEADRNAPPADSPAYIEHWRACMRVDIAQLTRCDSIALLPGWEKSSGATKERQIALWLGMRVIFLTTEAT